MPVYKASTQSCFCVSALEALLRLGHRLGGVLIEEEFNEEDGFPALVVWCVSSTMGFLCLSSVHYAIGTIVRIPRGS